MSPSNLSLLMIILLMYVCMNAHYFPKKIVTLFIDERIFLENGITGYDFLEIAENGGEVLQNELGINKASFRNKIVRQMQSRMLGIGSSPETPKKFTHKLESCKAVTLSWEFSVARVFPVHSYRMQRRAINLFGGSEP